MILARALGQPFVALVRPTSGGRHGGLSLHVAGPMNPRCPPRPALMTHPLPLVLRRSAMDSPEPSRHLWTVLRPPVAVGRAGARV